MSDLLVFVFSFLLLLLLLVLYFISLMSWILYSNEWMMLSFFFYLGPAFGIWVCKFHFAVFWDFRLAGNTERLLAHLPKNQKAHMCIRDRRIPTCASIYAFNVLWLNVNHKLYRMQVIIIILTRFVTWHVIYSQHVRDVLFLILKLV